MFMKLLNIFHSLLISSKSKQARSLRIILMMIIIIAVGRLIQVYMGNFYSGEREPYLQSLGSESVVIRWQTAEKVKGQLRFGLNQNRLDQLITEELEREEHEIKLKALRPDTQYYYSVGDKKKVFRQGPEHWFRTALARDSDKAVRVWVLGDPGYDSEQHDKVRASMLDWVEKFPRKGRPAFDMILTTGDNAYRSGTNKQFQKNFFNLYKNIFLNTAVWPVYGNHDARRWAFFNIFSFPENAEAGGVASQSERYYSFDYGRVHFVMLDSFDGAKTNNDEMMQWLKKDLEANQSRWLVAAMHHPPYSKGNQDSDIESDSRGRLFNTRENILPLLEDYGVDLVLSGHSHSYERSQLIDCHYGSSDSFNNKMLVDKGQLNPATGSKIYHKSAQPRSHQGAVFAVVGSTAKLNASGTFDHPVMDVGLAEFGSFVFDVEQDTLTGRFINQAGLEKDVFVLRKQNKEKFESACR